MADIQTLDSNYLNIAKTILNSNNLTTNRTAVKTYSFPGVHLRHDMSQGFPLLTTKKVPYKSVFSELEFFIKGLNSKKWLQERNNPIWNEWCNPKKVPYNSVDKETHEKMSKEDDLGLIYGVQWNDFRDPSHSNPGDGVNQLQRLINTLKSNPTDRRMIVTAWNPLALDEMALPPCHLFWQVTVTNNKLNLFFYMRSADWFLGVPFNIASYGLLLHLLAKESGYEEGILNGFFADAHIYTNHLDAIKEQLTRQPRPLPKTCTETFTDIYNWKYTDTDLLNYNPHPRIKAPIAI